MFYYWFINSTKELVHLELLLTSVILEIVFIVLIIVKNGLKYLPEIKTNKNINETIEFMEKFVTTGTSATIVSNRVSWLVNNNKLIQILKNKIENGLKIEIITNIEVNPILRNGLIGADFYITNEKIAPESRFTLINGDRSGSERLAISKGIYPEHEITIFDNYSDPQIIAMAKDNIRKSKELANGE